MQCPVCGSEEFYIKDPEDEYETYDFKCHANQVVFQPDIDKSELPDVNDDTEAYCSTCTWHDKFGTIKKE